VETRVDEVEGKEKDDVKPRMGDTSLVVSGKKTEAQLTEIFKQEYAISSQADTFPIRCAVCLTACYLSKKSVRKHIQSSHPIDLRSARADFAKIQDDSYLAIGKKVDAFMSLCCRPTDEQREELFRRQKHRKVLNSAK
jgi:hypothetical protein